MNEQAPLLRDKVLDGVVRQEVTFPCRPMILARLSPKERSYIRLCDLVNVKTILII